MLKAQEDARLLLRSNPLVASYLGQLLKPGSFKKLSHRDILEAIILSNSGRRSYRKSSGGFGGWNGGGSTSGGFGGGFGGGGFGGGGASGGW